MTQLCIAEPKDSAELCRLVKQVPVPGALSLVYGRDPDFFAFLPAEGHTNQVAVAKKDSVITSVAMRSIRSLYVNGAPADVGYFHGLRTLPAYRNRGHFGRGFLHMRALHEKDKLARAYLATVIDDNSRTRAMLAKERRNFPRFFDKGRYITYALPLKRSCKTRRSFPAIERGSRETLPEIVRFLNDNGSRRQFYPAYTEQDFCRFSECGLVYKNIFVYRNRGAVTAVLGIWDQNVYKQSSVHSYGGFLKYARPIVNAGLQAAGYHPLPGPGMQFRVVYACFACSKDDRPQPLASLLDHALCEWSGKGCHFLIAGFHERDPLRQVVHGRLKVSYPSRLYLAAWRDGWEFCGAVSDQRIPYLEAGLL